MSLPRRPKGESRSAPHEGTPVSAAHPNATGPQGELLAAGEAGDPAPSTGSGEIEVLQQVRQALMRTQNDARRWAAAEDRAQQRERRRIARELHDDLQQTLATIQLELAALGALLSATPADGAGASALLPHVGQLAQTALESTRRIVNDLRPAVLEDLGLVPALEALVGRLSRHGLARYRFEASGDWEGADPLPPDVAHSLYRVAQEALNNVTRHARAQQVDVSLQLGRDGGILMRIHDDGCGIAPEAWHKPAALGLLGMHERVHAVGGDLRVDSVPAAGTTVEVVLRADRRSAQAAELQNLHPGDAEFESLLGFLYSAPIGMVQTRLDGRIEMLNPMAANLLMPLAVQGRLDNLFAVLRGVLPQLRTQAHAVRERSGIVCQNLPVPMPGHGARALTLSVLKQDGSRLMVMLSPADAALPLATPAIDPPPAR